MRRWSVVAVAAVLCMGIAAPSQAVGGQVLYHIRGTVTDPLGRPLAGATVDDGTQRVVTDASGAFALPEENPGTYTIRAGRRDTTTETKVVSANVPADPPPVGFVLRYRITGVFERRAVTNATGPVDDALVIESAAPPGDGGSDAGRSCIQVTNPFTGDVVAAVPTGEVGAAWGGSVWRTTVTVPADAAENLYSATFVASSCTTGTILSVASGASVIVDTTAPGITDVRPAATNEPDPVVFAGVVDGAANYPSGISATASAITVDGTRLPTEYDANGDRLVARAHDLATGAHTVTVVATDNAGNTTTTSRDVVVDLDAPRLADAAPTGSIATATPELSVGASDVGSGLDPASVTLTLSNGVLTCALPARFDAATGRIAYTPPARVEGVCPGQGPLLDGTYQVAVSIRDLTGNVSRIAWSFSVRTLPL